MIKNSLKEIRMQEYMLNKRDFSKKLNIAEQQYLRYENLISTPSLEIALRISKELNKTVNEIWHLDD